VNGIRTKLLQCCILQSWAQEPGVHDFQGLTDFSTYYTLFTGLQWTLRWICCVSHVLNTQIFSAYPSRHGSRYWFKLTTYPQHCIILHAKEEFWVAQYVLWANVAGRMASDGMSTVLSKHIFKMQLSSHTSLASRVAVWCDEPLWHAHRRVHLMMQL